MLRPVLSIAAIVAAATVNAASLEVVDGDRLRIDGTLVRLVGIDSPELCQPGGREARQALVVLLEGTLTYELEGRDTNGTPLVRLFADGREVNQSLVQLGWAWDAMASTPSRYAFAQSVAKGDRIGLWAYEDPIPPWSWKQLAGNTRAETCSRLSQRSADLHGDGPVDDADGAFQQRRLQWRGQGA